VAYVSPNGVQGGASQDLPDIEGAAIERVQDHQHADHCKQPINDDSCPGFDFHLRAGRKASMSESPLSYAAIGRMADEAQRIHCEFIR
jgi:hypothetical protein